MASYRNCCFTLNNYTDAEEEKVMSMTGVKYLIVGKELGDEGTPHLQGYVEFKSSKKLLTLKNINGRIHWEKRMGTAKQAAEYCKKEGSYKEVGTISKQGERKDLDIAAEMVMDGASDQEIAAAIPKTFIIFNRGIKSLRETFREHRTGPPRVAWLWGGTGVGKTRTAVEAHNSYYIKDATRWWDGYEQQEAIIIDDYDGSWPYRDFLRLLDRYPYQGQIKGGYVRINSPFIYITCEFSPEYFYQGTEFDQIERRVSTVTQLTSSSITAEVQNGNTMHSGDIDDIDVDDNLSVADKCKDSVGA